jgi:hypothetical protein
VVFVRDAVCVGKCCYKGLNVVTYRLHVLVSVLYSVLYVVLCPTDFMSLEIEGGYARLLVDYGSGTVSVEQREIRLLDGKPHRVDILWSKTVSFSLCLIPVLCCLH